MAIVLNKVGNANSITASEIPAFDPVSKRLYVVAASTVDIVAASTVDIYVVSNTGALTKSLFEKRVIPSKRVKW